MAVAAGSRVHPAAIGGGYTVLAYRPPRAAAGIQLASVYECLQGGCMPILVLRLYLDQVPIIKAKPLQVFYESAYFVSATTLGIEIFDAQHHPVPARAGIQPTQ